MNPRRIRHGTIGEFTNHGCRCEPCKKVYYDYQKRRRKRLVKEGYCSRCLKNPKMNGSSKCEDCLEKFKEFTLENEIL